MHSREALTRDFLALGVQPGDVVMLHASVRAIGEITGGPDQIHLALKDALTPEGTLMMYASCPRYYDEVGRGRLSAALERDLLETLPAFEAQSARSAPENGAMVELFRTYPGSTVNDHVVRFVFWGRHSTHLRLPQPWDFAFGKGSALERFLELDGKILLLGCDHDNSTFLHYVEHILEVPGKRIARYRVPVKDGGRRVWREMAEYDTADAGAHPNWPPRFFAKLADSYMAQKGNYGGSIGEARAYLFPARELMEFALPIMKAVAADPHAADGLRERPKEVSRAIG